MAFEIGHEALIAGWSGADPVRVRQETTRFNHRLRETGLFEDEALAKLLDEFPRDEVTICTMRPNPPAEDAGLPERPAIYPVLNWSKP